MEAKTRKHVGNTSTVLKPKAASPLRREPTFLLKNTNFFAASPSRSNDAAITVRDPTAAVAGGANLDGAGPSPDGVADGIRSGALDIISKRKHVNYSRD